MGNAISGAVQTAEQQALATETQVQADLNNLSEILTSKANEYFVKLVNSKGEDKTIPIKTIIDYKKHVSASVSSGPSQQLNDAINELFGGNFMASMKAMALGAIDAVLGNTSVGSRDERGYKVLLLNNTIVRVDYYVYGFNMHTQTGTVDRTRNGLAFVATVGVVDMQRVGLEALVYLVGSQANTARGFLNQRSDTWLARRKALLAFQTNVLHDNDADFMQEETFGEGLRQRPDNIPLETVQQYLEEAEAETDASSPPASTSGGADGGLSSGSSGRDPALEAKRVKAVKKYNSAMREFKARRGDLDPYSIFLLYQAAWDLTATLAVTQINRVIAGNKDLLRSMRREQEAILEDMLVVYTKARAINAAIQGVTVTR